MPPWPYNVKSFNTTPIKSICVCLVKWLSEDWRGRFTSAYTFLIMHEYVVAKFQEHWSSRRSFLWLREKSFGIKDRHLQSTFIWTLIILTNRYECNPSLDIPPQLVAVNVPFYFLILRSKHERPVLTRFCWCLKWCTTKTKAANAERSKFKIVCIEIRVRGSCISVEWNQEPEVIREPLA